VIRGFLILLLLVMASGCGQRKDRLAEALGNMPSKVEKREFGQDYVKNMLYPKSEAGFMSVAEVVERLRDRGLLDGGIEDQKFHGSPFLIEDGEEILDRKAYVFASEEVALIVYELKDAVLIEVNKW